MSSEAITRNDLTNILNKVLPGYTVTENTDQLYNVILSPSVSGPFNPVKDTTNKYDDDADNMGLTYRSGCLCTPQLCVGDIDYTLTTEDYDSISDLLDSLGV